MYAHGTLAATCGSEVAASVSSCLPLIPHHHITSVGPHSMHTLSHEHGLLLRHTASASVLSWHRQQRRRPPCASQTAARQTTWHTQDAHRTGTHPHSHSHRLCARISTPSALLRGTFPTSASPAVGGEGAPPPSPRHAAMICGFPRRASCRRSAHRHLGHRPV